MNRKVDDDISDLEYQDWLDSEFYNLDYTLNRSDYVCVFMNQMHTNIPITLDSGHNHFKLIYIHTGDNC